MDIASKTHVLTYRQDNADTVEVQSAMKELSEALFEADKVALKMKKQEK